MMWHQFNGEGLFVFSDPAGAKACLALNEIITEKGIQGSRVLLSNKEYSFYKDFTGSVKVIKTEEAKEYVKEMQKFDWIFAGTSDPKSSGCFELICIENADAISFSFVDHWSNFHLRFEFGNRVIFPDNILVLDERARKLAIKDGLPAEKMRLLKNPYHTYLRGFSQKAVKKSELCIKYKIPAAKKILVFAPDPVSLYTANGKNEADVLKELVDDYYINDNFFILLKLHPLQPLDQIQSLIEKFDLTVIRDLDFSPVDIFTNADIILGFYSNYLLEAALFNNNVIRYKLEGNAYSDLFPENVGVCAESKPELINILKSIK
jgi:hypothetical protein